MISNQNFMLAEKFLNQEIAKRQTMEFFAEKCLKAIKSEDPIEKLNEIRSISQKNSLTEEKWLRVAKILLAIVCIATAIFTLYAIIYRPIKYINILGFVSSCSLLPYFLCSPSIKTHSRIELDFLQKILDLKK